MRKKKKESNSHENLWTKRKCNRIFAFQCLRNGTWLLLDQVNLCSPAILDRLNGLLEPNGALTIGEKGVDENGDVFTVRPHKDFRLFLAMDPRHGEISRQVSNLIVRLFRCDILYLRETIIKGEQR